MNPIVEDLMCTINQHAIHYISVQPTSRNPGFVYSCGLTLQGHPDLIIVGIQDPLFSIQLLQYLGGLVLSGQPISIGNVIATPMGTNVRIGPVNLDKCPLVLGGMVSVCRQTGVEASAVQVIWHDNLGRYPGDFGCDENVVLAQWILDGYTEVIPVKEGDIFVQMSCFHCGKTPCSTALCDRCKLDPELVNDGKSHGSTCPDCFNRVQASSLVGWLNSVDEHNQYCEKHPEHWNPDRKKIDCRIIYPLCKSVSNKCYQMQRNQTGEVTEILIFAMLQEEAKMRYNTNLVYLSRATQECLNQRVTQMLHKLHQKTLHKSLSF